MGVASVKLMFKIIFSFETVLVSSPVLWLLPKNDNKQV